MKRTIQATAIALALFYTVLSYQPNCFSQSWAAGASSASDSWVYSYYRDHVGPYTLLPIGNIISTSDGGYIVGTGGLTKVSQDGRPLWHKEYYASELVILNTHEQDGYVSAGTGSDVTTTWVVVKRVALDGSLIWRRELRLRGDDGCSAGVATIDGNYLFAASSYNPERRIVALWLIKMTGMGSVLWQKEYNVQRAGSMSELAGGDILVSTDGYSLIRLSAGGVVRWQRKYSNSTGCCVYGIHRITPDASIILAGDTHDGIQVARFTAGGQLMWTRAYRPIERIEDIQVGADGGYYLLGRTPVSTISSAPPERSWLVKLDDRGNVLWNKTYGNGKREFVPNAIFLAHDGILLSAGSNWLLHTDVSGNVESCRPITKNATLLSELSSLHSQRLYPKAFTARGNIRVTSFPPVSLGAIRTSICH